MSKEKFVGKLQTIKRISLEEVTNILTDRGYNKAISLMRTVMFWRFEEDGEYAQIVFKYRYGFFRPSMLFIDIDYEGLVKNRVYTEQKLERMISDKLNLL